MRVEGSESEVQDEGLRLRVDEGLRFGVSSLGCRVPGVRDRAAVLVVARHHHLFRVWG